jgi:TPR repeat protein
MTSVPKLTVDQAIGAQDERRYGVAFRALKYWAEQEDASAFHMLGFMYDVGQGTRRSRARAIYWYKRAYSCGESIAASNLATIHRDSGQPRLEFDWYKRAADLGDGDALVEVGIRYLSGKGVQRNVLKATKCFATALRSKHICEDGRDVARQLLWGCKKTRASS